MSGRGDRVCRKPETRGLQKSHRHSEGRGVEDIKNVTLKTKTPPPERDRLGEPQVVLVKASGPEGIAPDLSVLTERSEQGKGIRRRQSDWLTAVSGDRQSIC